MPKVEYSYLDESSYNLVKEKILNKVSEAVKSSDFEMDFMDGFGETNRIYFYARNPVYSAIEEYIDSDSFSDFCEEIEKQYGHFVVYPMRIAETGATDVKLGDLVLIDKTLGEKQVGVVISTMLVDNKTFYGCSYLTIELLKDFSWTDGLSLTEEGYGGYHEGFEKVLTPKEAEIILKKELLKQCRKATEQIKVSREKTIAQINNLLTNISEKRQQEVQKIERIRFKTGSLMMHNDLKVEIGPDDEDSFK